MYARAPHSIIKTKIRPDNEEEEKQTFKKKKADIKHFSPLQNTGQADRREERGKERTYTTDCLVDKTQM